jgi:hypothetical protein
MHARLSPHESLKNPRRVDYAFLRKIFCARFDGPASEATDYGRSAARSSVGDFWVSLLKTRLNWESD